MSKFCICHLLQIIRKLLTMAMKKFVRIEGADNLANSPSLDLIEPKLYLGNRYAAMDPYTLMENHITHILSIDTTPLPRDIENKHNITVSYIYALDMPVEDLIRHFDNTYEFINDAIKDGSVLVHCYFGISRSATIVIAYLMKKYNYTFDKAFEEVKSKRFFVNPNPGFVYQLHMYQEMKCIFNSNNMEYKHFRLKNAGEQFKNSGIFRLEFSDIIKPDPLIVQGKTVFAGYCCRACGRFLISDENLLKHHVPYENIVCTASATVEPLSWMEGVVKVQEGNINCPKCSTKIGYFSWISQFNCSCGFILNPFFMVYSSKVFWYNNHNNTQH